MEMKWFWLIFLMPAIAFAGSETHRPNANARVEIQYSVNGCAPGAHYTCLSDQDDGTYAYSYDNSDENHYMLLALDNTAVSDSTIDSVIIVSRVRVTNVGNTFTICDSVAGQSAGLRQSSTIALSGTGAYEQDTVRYTTTPDAAAFTWTDIDAYNIGVYTANINNNQQIDFGEIWAVVYYHATGTGYEMRRRRSLTGDR